MDQDEERAVQILHSLAHVLGWSETARLMNRLQCETRGLRAPRAMAELIAGKKRFNEALRVFMGEHEDLLRTLEALEVKAEGGVVADEKSAGVGEKR